MGKHHRYAWLALAAVLGLLASAATAADGTAPGSAAAASSEPAETAAAPSGSCSADDRGGVAGSSSSCGCGALSRDSPAPADAQDPSASADSTTRRDTDTAAATDAGEEDPADSQLVQLKGGWFWMGSDAGFFPEDGEGPVRRVFVDAFAIGAHEVSNERFKRFTEATGYVTDSERFNNSFVVEQFISPEVSKHITNAVAAAPWWLPVDGANWQHPEGPDTDLEGRWNHPAVHISWNDAMAFCRWSAGPGGRLPTEAEWEFAARGRLHNRTFPWGNKLLPKGQHRANVWQSAIADEFLSDRNVFKHSFLPTHDGHRFYSAPNTAEDGYALTAPVDAFPPNKYGLYNTVGNVWEWVMDWHSTSRADQPERNPVGPPAGTNKVKKGGSYMCHQFTCYRYRNAARMFITPDSGAGNLGFRCAVGAPVDIQPPPPVKV